MSEDAWSDEHPKYKTKDVDFCNGCTGCALFDEARGQQTPECTWYNCTKGSRKDGRCIIFVNKE